MKYILIFIIIIISASLFFIRFNTLNSAREEKTVIGINVEVEEKPDSKTHDTTKAQPAPAHNTSVAKSVKKKRVNKEKNMHQPAEQEQQNNRFVFQTYDYMANAQAFIAHLKNNGLNFTVESKKNLASVEISFEFSDEKDKQNKLKSITKITGISFNPK